MQITRILRASSKVNPTGFSIKEFRRAARVPERDPWAANESWRTTGEFTRAERFKGALPGFGTASVAFAIYCAYEHFFLKDEHHHDGTASAVTAH
ncbi:hypothetical protein B0T20DRAFT_195778 [Sordaria brevicollis]|uniref:NADH-ubiquinone oxidoreductase B12 subunit n=1 Tax=Sordaria brevicollis TaxID=83679 RepID=A0AAE0PG25_SORBR|nr:hypothetical protein B0T20DRAFT_195778 [Sordaria brevicollis]